MDFPVARDTCPCRAGHRARHGVEVPNGGPTRPVVTHTGGNMHRTTLRRAGLAIAATGTAAVLAAAPAMAHHCFVPLYSLDGAPSSANWFVLTAADGAMFEAGYEPACDA